MAKGRRWSVPSLASLLPFLLLPIAGCRTSGHAVSNRSSVVLDGSGDLAVNGGHGEAPDAMPNPDEQLCGSACMTTDGIVCADRMGQVACVAKCLQALRDEPKCGDQSRALLTCFIAAGADGFTCNAVAGATVLKAGNCNVEQRALSACLQFERD